MPKFSQIEINGQEKGELSLTIKEPRDGEAYHFDLQGQVLSEKLLDNNRKALVAADIEVKKNFQNQLTSQIKGNKLHLEANFENLINSDQRFSLIPIHKEMYMHSLRIARVLTDNINGQIQGKNKDKIKDEAFKFTFDHIYKRLNKDIANYLNENQNVSVATLNQFIDKKRKTYAIFAETMTASYLKTQYPEIQFPNKDDLKKSLEKKTADDIDIVFQNQVTGLTTHIQGNENSSHSKKEKNPAFMVMKQYDQQGNLLQTQYRVPSLTIPKINNAKQSIADQINNAVKPIVEGGFELKKNDGPIVYNLLTSIPIFWDSCNQQSSAEKIFKGMHQYNANIAKNVKNYDDKPYFYVMNLPINQHTHELNYDKWNTAAKEALFLSDLAVFNSMKSYLSQEGKNSLDTLNQQYEGFLNNPNRGDNDLFCKSQYADAAKNAALVIKNSINNDTIVDLGLGNKEKLAKTFLKLYSSKYHGENANLMQNQKQFASILQAMQLSLGDHNFKGCKSANERFSYVENLSQLFLAYQKKTLNDDINDDISKQIDFYLTNLPSGEDNSFNENADNLIKELHQINNNFNVYNSGIMPSVLDTGTPKCKMNYGNNALEVGGTNTNYFAANCYTNISQESASSVQAHSGIPGRLSKICQLTDKRISRYEGKYKQNNPVELCCAVLRDYANSWGWAHHHKDAANDVLKNKLMDGQLQDKTIGYLKKIIEDLHFDISSSKKFSQKSSLNTRLIFLETKLSKMDDAQDLAISAQQ